jgi:hypothetical protein
MWDTERLTLTSVWLSWLHNARLLANKMVNFDHRTHVREVHHLCRKEQTGSEVPAMFRIMARLYYCLSKERSRVQTLCHKRQIPRTTADASGSTS